MTDQINTTPGTMTESGFSANLKATNTDGFEVMFTVRQPSGYAQQFYSELENLFSYLNSNGYTARPSGGNGNGYRAPAPSSGGTSSTPARKPDGGAWPGEEEDDNGFFKVCPIHGDKAYRKTNAKGSWYSHKDASGSWCNKTK